MKLDISVLSMRYAPLLLQIGLGFTIAISPFIRRQQRRVMFVIAALCFTRIAGDFPDKSDEIGYFPFIQFAE